MRLAQNKGRVASYERALADAVNALPGQDRKLATAMLQVLHITPWLEMRDHWGLDGKQIARATGWAVRTLLKDLEKGGRSRWMRTFPSRAPTALAKAYVCFRPIEDITGDGVTGCHAIRVVTMCIHHGMVLTHRTHGNISTNAGTPISVAGCKRRSLTRSHATSGTANTIAHSHQSGSQSGYGSQPMRPTAGE